MGGLGINRMLDKVSRCQSEEGTGFIYWALIIATGDDDACVWVSVEEG